MKYLVFDIETVRNEEVSWKPPADNPKEFPPIPAHKIVSIGGMILSISTIHKREEKNSVLWFGNYGSHELGEKSFIKGFLNSTSEGAGCLVSYNGRGFDIPVILHRCMRHGIQAAKFYDQDFRKRFDNGKNIDLLEQFSEYGATKRSTLEILCQSLGMPGKMDVDGGQVQHLYDAGRLDEIDSYCLCDVAETAWLLIRFLHLKGAINNTTNYNSIHAIRSAISSRYNEMLTKLLESTNIARLSLDEQEEEDLKNGKQQQLFSESIKQDGSGAEGEEFDSDIPF